MYLRADGSPLWVLVEREPAPGPRRHPRRAPPPGQRLQRPAPDPRRADREPAPARRRTAHRPDRHLGVGRPARPDHRLRGPAPALRHPSRLLPRHLRPGAGERAPRRPGDLSSTPYAGRWAARTSSRSRCGSTARTTGSGPAAAASSIATGRARSVVVTGTHQDITEAKQAEIALEDQVRQNTLMQAIASAANEAHTLEDVLVQARSLVLLHDDWERARAFVLAEDGAGVVPLHVRPEDRADDEATPGGDGDGARAREPRVPRRRVGLGRRSGSPSRFPIRYDGAVYAVVTITSAPPLYRHDLIQTMVEQVAVQLGRVVERQIAQRAARRRPRRRDGGVPAEVGVPGDDEPRDPDPAQRRDRPERPAPAHPARRRPAAARLRRPGTPAGRCWA